MIGQTVGHYRILDKLGAGGMGEVYLAEDTTLRRRVALKVLPPDLAASQDRLERFQREAETLAALDHPNIVHIYTVEEAEGVRFLTMQLVEGKRLSELIPKSGMPLERIFKFATPLADALAAAHEKGVIHRDLKPGNIMVTKEGRVKVLDFGLAKLRPELDAGEATELPTEPLTDEGRILGTVPYMSPEQLEGKEIDARTDIFSLGVILYELAAGERPFTGDSSVSIISSIIRDTPLEVDSQRTELPHHLARIIRHCLEKDPEKRFQAAKDVRNELEDLRREGISHETVAASPAAGREGHAKTRWWLATATVLVLLGLTFGYLLLRTESRQDAVMVSEAEPPMIVVLPFENLGSPEDEYFADGMTEEITSRLAVVSGLRVISRTSAMQYKENRPPLKQIGEELGVDYVLEGSVRWAGAAAGSRVRITPQLIRVADDSHLWAGSYDRVIEDVFGIQSDIASTVVQELGVTLLEPERQDVETRPTENLAAYEAYLKGINLLADPDRSEANYRMATQMFELAIELDPGFALAHSQLSLASSILFHEKFDASQERLKKAREAAEAAVELAPDLPQAHIAMGAFYYHGQRELDRALEELRLAEVRLPNDAEVRLWIGAVLRRQTRFQDAIAYFEKAISLDPRAAMLSSTLGVTYMITGRYEDAERSFRRSIALVPDQERAFYFLGFSDLKGKGKVDSARVILEEMPRTDEPRSIWTWMFLELCAGNYSAALDWISQSPAEFTNFGEYRVPRALWEGLILERLNKPDQARASYESALRALARELKDQIDSPSTHSNLGWAYAALGRKEEAIREGRLAVELVPTEGDSMAGPVYLEKLAHIYAIVGDHDLALDQIELLLSIPSFTSVPLLGIDPRWDPLRDHPGFQGLLEKHGQQGE